MNVQSLTRGGGFSELSLKEKLQMEAQVKFFFFVVKQKKKIVEPHSKTALQHSAKQLKQVARESHFEKESI